MEEADGVKDVRVNVEAEPGVTGFMVEKALKEALGFSPRGDVYPMGGLFRTEGKAQRVFCRREALKALRIGLIIPLTETTNKMNNFS